MSETQLKCTTRHVRLFTAVIEGNNLVPDPNHLTLDLDPDNEFVWDEAATNKIQTHFKDLVASYSGRDLNDYNLRKIGSELEGMIRKLLQTGELSYNPNSRVLNYSMGLPRTNELL